MQRRWLLLLAIPIGASAWLPDLRAPRRAATVHERETPASPAEPSVLASNPPLPETASAPPPEAAEEAVATPPAEAHTDESELAAAPELAPTRIHDLARDAKDERERDAAARTLARWLHEETRRDTRDARGNVPNLIEALGALGGDRAMRTLNDALDDDRHDLALKTLILQQLGEHADARALSRFIAFARRGPVRSDFDAELQTEALATAYGEDP